LLSLEITNIAYIGPGLPLAPGADPADKALEVVAVEESQREEMVKRLRAPRGNPPLTSGRARSISLRVKGACLRLDDGPIGTADGTLDLTIEFGWSIKILKGHC
jgi:hypothetical protein